jgi:hypothetical protein
MTDMGRLEPFAIVSFRPTTAVCRGLAQGPLADQKAVVRTTFLRRQVLVESGCGAVAVGSHSGQASIFPEY